MFARARGSNEAWFATASSSVRPEHMELWEVRSGAELFLYEGSFPVSNFVMENLFVLLLF